MHLWFQWSQLNDMVTIWCAALIEESGSVLVSFFLFLIFFGCQLDPEGSHFYRAKKPVVFTQEMAFRWRNSYRETIPSSGKKETKQNKIQHLPHSQPEVLLKKWIKKILLQRVMLSIIKVQYHIHRIYIYNLKLLFIKICKICT